eukprot:scaffold11396_cov66-Phaeocystis_antarctica.AAC.3
MPPPPSPTPAHFYRRFTACRRCPSCCWARARHRRARCSAPTGLGASGAPPCCAARCSRTKHTAGEVFAADRARQQFDGKQATLASCATVQNPQTTLARKAVQNNGES